MAAPPLSAGTPHASARRLAAVWFADIVGFSGLASRDENAALEQIHNFQTVSRTAAVRHGGRIVKFLGDGAFAEFPSTEAAVRAALALHENFAEPVDEMTPGPALRIGVHVGDVIARQDGDLYGDGINTASRLQAEAGPGQILVSGDVWRQLRTLRDLEFRPLGSRELRGIDHPIEVYALACTTADGAAATGGIGTFVRELKRRHVFRVGLAYLLVAWLVIQIAATIGPPLGLPRWTTTLVIVWAALGLPIALVLAWAFEMTPQGIVRAGAAASPAPPRNRAEAGVPPDATSRASIPVRHPLPELVTHFVGREPETREIGDLLTGGGCRLVTLTGPGGIGKTSLALHVAREHGHHFSDGTVFVPLAAQTSGTAVLPLVAERLGVTLAPGVDARLQMTDYLRDKSMLVVLDNFEQLVEHSGVLSEMLDVAPSVRALVTSRERLNLKAEIVYPLDGLPAEPGRADNTAEPDAVRLFIECARRLNPHFRLVGADRAAVTDLCRHLEGVPLAIELAAAWTRSLGCREILAEVRSNADFLASDMQDIPERHRSVAAVFESAWQRLTDEERTALKRLSIFQGPFEASAAATVAGVDIGTLSSLLDQSLLRRRVDGHFEMLEILRQYAAEKLASDELQFGWIAERHARHYLAPASAGTEASPRGRAAAELENVLAAWNWAVASRRFDLVAAALEAIFDHYQGRGRSSEGSELFAAAARVLEEEGRGNAPLLAAIRIRLGVFESFLGRSDEAERHLTAGAEVAEATGESRETALAYQYLATVAMAGGRYAEASQFFERSQQLYRTLNMSREIGRTSVGLGNVAYVMGNLEEARAHYTRSLPLLREAGDLSGLAMSYCNLGILASTGGDHAHARRLLEQGLATAREAENQRAVIQALQNLAVNSFGQGNDAEAERFAAEGVQLAQEIGFHAGVLALLNVLGKTYQRMGRTGEAIETYQAAFSTAGRQLTPVLLDLLLSSAQLVGSDQPVPAVVVASFVAAHSAADVGTRTDALAYLEKIKTAVDGDVGLAAETRGRQTPLSEILALLSDSLGTLEVEVAVNSPPLTREPIT